MTKWEYGLTFLGDLNLGDKDQIQARLAEMGANGWELVGLRENWGYFKRPTKPEMPALLVVNNIPGAEFEQLADDIKAEIERWWEESIR